MLPAQRTSSRQADPAVEPRLDPYRPLSSRLRGLIVLLTLATVVLIAVLMLQPHRRLMAAKAARAQAAALAACPVGQASAAPGCPGGRMEVMVLPATRASGGR
jgi:hypothetical protein